MKSDICLVILFNHRYEKNIPKLFKFYGKRFDEIRILIPFYRSEIDTRIIQVYGNSYNFQEYITQAYSQIKSDSFNHYVFIGDDCILNPKIDQSNIVNYLNLNHDSSFITEIRPLVTGSLTWANFTERKIGFDTPGVEFSQELPDAIDALKKIKTHEMFSQIPDRDFIEYQTVNKFIHLSINLYQKIISHLFKKKTRISLKPFPKISKKLPFPLLRGYSDFFTVNRNSFDEFVHLCGVFSSMRMFAEIAIPTALALSSQRLVNLQSTDFQAKAFWGDSRNIDLEKLKAETNGNINELFLGERQNFLWYHPIKLSSWEVK